MFSIHADLSISIRFQPLIAADLESLRWQHQKRFAVFLKQVSNGHLLFIMEFRCLLLMPHEQLPVIAFDLREVWHRYKQVGTVKVYLPFHVPLFPSGIRITEPYPEMVMGAESGKSSVSWIASPTRRPTPVALSKINSGATPPMNSKISCRPWQTHSAVSPPNTWE